VLSFLLFFALSFTPPLFYPLTASRTKIEYFYNVETKRTKFDKPKEGYMWERKLEMLKQLTPRKVDETTLKRGLTDAEQGHPDRWKWRETNAEQRKRLQFLKAKDSRAKANEKRRREKPTKREQVKRRQRRRAKGKQRYGCLFYVHFFFFFFINQFIRFQASIPSG
jgi:hypothetical protein